jgi:ComF family protein
MKIVHNWLNIIQDYLLPPTCILCGNKGFDGYDICFHCKEGLPRNTQCCYRCAEILPQPTLSPILCGHCLSSPPAFDETHAPFLYQGEIRHLITSLKFGAHYKNARLLAMLLAEHLKTSSESPDLIMPVPLHKSRYRARHFNQAIEIAKTVSKELLIPVDITSCLRHAKTPHQSSLTAKQRHKNIKNAFSIAKPLTVDHVAILDDVMTTGSTVNELAILLKDNGVSRVDVWVCARA